MKSIAYVALHYGKEYLAWAIRSIQDAVSEIHILYSDQPSFGFGTSLGCPDSEEELRREASRFTTIPVHWHKDRWPHEAAHRRFALDVAYDAGADRLLVLDADELWPPGAAKQMLEESYQHHEKDFLAKMKHFWRSFDWICHDPCLPVRIINPKGSGTCYLADPKFPHLLHFGYAQSAAITRYKESIHGHKSEWRGGWFEEKFAAWTPGCGMKDVHPTNHQNFWEPKPVSEEERGLVGVLLGDHPYFGKPMIE